MDQFSKLNLLVCALCTLQAGSSEWLEMSHSWGANWIMNGGPLRGPFSVQLTSLSSAKSLIAIDVIPQDW